MDVSWTLRLIKRRREIARSLLKRFLWIVGPWALVWALPIALIANPPADDTGAVIMAEAVLVLPLIAAFVVIGLRYKSEWLEDERLKKVIDVDMKGVSAATILPDGSISEIHVSPKKAIQ